jgi:hypothetical protein
MLQRFQCIINTKHSQLQTQPTACFYLPRYLHETLKRNRCKSLFRFHFKFFLLILIQYLLFNDAFTTACTILVQPLRIIWLQKSWLKLMSKRAAVSAFRLLGGVRLSTLGTNSTVGPILLAPDYRWMWNSIWNENWHVKLKDSEETCPIVT